MPSLSRPSSASLSLLTLTLALAACGPRVWRPALHAPAEVAEIDSDPAFLKAHLHSGDVVVFTTWTTPPRDGVLEGNGTRYDAFRTLRALGPTRLALDSIALLESNDPGTVGRFGFSGLALFSGLNAFVAIACLADPKSCFGSCPTFYVQDGGGERLVAEGFSSSFARVLEDTDVDVLPAGASGRRFSLEMRNEAPETHAVQSVRLLVVPREGEVALLPDSDGTLRRVLSMIPPHQCGGAKDCRQLQLSDGQEYFSETDPHDLALRETLELEFPGAPGELGLVVRARNTLVSTFLFYQTIAFLGRDAGAWLAALERGDPRVVERSLGLARELGGIEVEVQSGDGSWRKAGEVREAGPIASDAHLVVLSRPESDGGVMRVRLRMARGNWRIDQVALASLGEPVEPIALEPVSVEGPSGADPEALRRLVARDAYLVTQRGESYRLSYQLPADASQLHLLLESRGFYYEWMRGEWGGEEDPAMAALILLNPRAALRALAPAFKQREATMERTFWSSRFRRDAR